jgi:hypothetical protein
MPCAASAATTSRCTGVGLNSGWPRPRGVIGLAIFRCPIKRGKYSAGAAEQIPHYGDTMSNPLQFSLRGLKHRRPVVKKLVYSCLTIADALLCVFSLTLLKTNLASQWQCSQWLEQDDWLKSWPAEFRPDGWWRIMWPVTWRYRIKYFIYQWVQISVALLSICSLTTVYSDLAPRWLFSHWLKDPDEWPKL